MIQQVLHQRALFVQRQLQDGWQKRGPGRHRGLLWRKSRARNPVDGRRRGSARCIGVTDPRGLRTLMKVEWYM